MIRSSVFAICLVSVLALNLVECSDSSDNAFESKVEVKFVENLTDFLAANPGIKLQQLTKSETHNVRSGKIHLTHKKGNRIAGEWPFYSAGN